MVPPLEGAIRNGIIPLCCGMASGCFAFYMYCLQAQKAALQWSVLPSDDEHVKRQYFRHAIQLQQHSTTVAAMSVVSAVTCREAYVGLDIMVWIPSSKLMSTCCAEGHHSFSGGR